MLNIKLLPKKKNFYYIVVVCNRNKISRFIEKIGYYQPSKAFKDERIKLLKIDVVRTKFWLGRGAKAKGNLMYLISHIL